MNIKELMSSLYEDDENESYKKSNFLTYDEVELIIEALQTYLVACAYEEDLTEVEKTKKLTKKFLSYIAMYRKSPLN